MTRERAVELVINSYAVVLKVDENERGISILAYNEYLGAATIYYFSKRSDYISHQILSGVVVNTPRKLRVVENYLKYDC